MKTLVCSISFFAFTLNCLSQADTIQKQVTTETTADSTKELTIDITQAQFPDGKEARSECMKKNLVTPKTGLRKLLKDMVILNFAVSADDTIFNIKAVTGPKKLRDAAVATFRKMPKWIPATQDGKNVSSYVQETIFYDVSRR